MNVLVTGGGGYIGSVLVPKLLAAGHGVTALDLFYYGAERLPPAPGLRRIQGDIRDTDNLFTLLDSEPFDAVIHLAAISNDPSSELDEALTRDVNLLALEPLMRGARDRGVTRFVYASSASVYGIKETPDVTEEQSLDPITLYAECKVEGERILNDLVDDDFCGVSVRSATVCGYSPRLRLDLTINILTHFALTRGTVRVFGGSQMRPNIHLQDIADFYVKTLEWDVATINGRAFNVSSENHSVMALAEMVRDEIGGDVGVEVVPTDDPRSYSLSAARAEKELGFRPARPLSLAPRELRSAYEAGDVPDPDGAAYRNVVMMKQRPMTRVAWRELSP